MSNILPKKSWHVYNDKNREKVKKDEQTARVEKERIEERSKAAEKEHRLSLLRSRADVDFSPKLFKEKQQNLLKNDDAERFHLFPEESAIKSSKILNLEDEKKKSNGRSIDVNRDHIRNDPLHFKEYKSSSKDKSNIKKYSFV